MPQILDLGEHGIHELPDDVTPDELQSFSDSFNPPKARAYPDQVVPEIDLVGLRANQGVLPGTPMGQFQNTTEGLQEAVPLINENIIKPIGQGLHSVGDFIYEGGVNRMEDLVEDVMGIPRQVPGIEMTTEEAVKEYPKPVQVGIRVGEGLARSAPQMAAAVVNPYLGAAAFGFTPEGFDPKAAAIAAALPILGSKTGLLTESMALKAGVTSNEALTALNRLGGVSGAAGLIAADEAIRISQLPKELQEQAWIDAAANVGSQFLLGGVGPIQRPALSRMSEAISTAQPQPRATVNESAVIRSGLPTRAAPEMLPELQRTKELVDQAIQEATQTIVQPGKVSALELLRRQNQEIVTPKADAPEFRPGGGEATGGKVSFNRAAEPDVAVATPEIVVEAPTPARDVTVESVLSSTPEDFFTQSSQWSKDSMAGKGDGPQIRAEKAARDNPDLAAWEAARDRSVAEYQAIKEAAQADPSLMADPAFQKRWSGAAQKTQFFGEGIKELQKNKAADVTQPPTPIVESAEAASLVPEATTTGTAESVTPDVTTVNNSDLISRLQRLKTDASGQGQLFSLPHPDAIKQIGKQLWNDSIDVAIAAVKAGRAVKAAIAEAVSHIKRNSRNYNETQIRQNLEQILKDEGLFTVKPAKSGSKAVPTTPEAGVSEVTGIDVPEGQKARKFSARATTSERIPTPVQEQIKTDPRSTYTPQKVATVREQVKVLSDAELGALTTESASFTEGKAELADRLFKAGKQQEGLDVIQNTSKELTRLGQIINQAKLLNSIAPENQILVIDQGLKKAGKDPLNEAQRGRILELGRQGKIAEGKLDAATTEWKNNPIPENAKKADDALKDKNRIDLEIQKFTNAFQPKTYAGLLKAMLQGNLLTPMSQTANIVGNMSFLPFRAGARSVASGLDFLESAITGRKRTSSVGPISGTVEAAKGLVRGATQIPSILKEGTGGSIVGERRAGIQPIKAWMNQFAQQPDMPTTGGKLTVNDRVKLLLEGTVGIAPEAMLRLLGAGDAPFKEAARSRVIAEQARLNKVPKEQWDMAQKFPELFFDSATLEQIKKDSLAAVFQRESKTLGLLTNWIAGRGEIFDLMVATIAPYKVTPWNIIGEILSFNPVLAFGKGVIEAAKGNVRGVNEAAGKLAVGTALTTAGYLLYKNGLLTPSLDSRDEQQKERILSQSVMPPNHINISGLKRWVEGGDPAFQPGDETKDIFRSGGLAGAIFYMTANIGRAAEKKPEGDMTDTMMDIATQSTLEQARFGLNQSFLSGVEGLLTSVKDGNTDSFVQKYMNTVASIPLPNSLAALSRATREYKPEFKADTFKGKIENIVKNRLGFAGLDDYLPLKRDLWGDPIPETPKGKNELFYQFFDVSKGQQITDDPKSIELYRLWRKTDDSKVIPTPPEKTQTFLRNSYPLTPEQQSDLAERVGGYRKTIVESMVTNPNWHNLTDEQKVRYLETAYRKGLEKGKAEFWMENKDALTPKPVKAGFKP